MEMKITNRSDRQVLLRLKSGMTRTLAPGEVADKLESVEVLGNARIEHLSARGLVSIEALEAKPARPRRGKATSGRSKKPRARAAGRRTSSSGGRTPAPATRPTAAS
jgi:hypothetical protein